MGGAGGNPAGERRRARQPAGGGAPRGAAGPVGVGELVRGLRRCRRPADLRGRAAGAGEPVRGEQDRRASSWPGSTRRRTGCTWCALGRSTTPVRASARSSSSPPWPARPPRRVWPGPSQLRVVTGNPDTRRDFTDVRDVVRAYRLLAAEAERGVSTSARAARSPPPSRSRCSPSCSRRSRSSTSVDPARVRAHEVMDLAGANAPRRGRGRLAAGDPLPRDDARDDRVVGAGAGQVGLPVTLIAPARLAQLVEHFTCNEEVFGSSPKAGLGKGLVIGALITVKTLQTAKVRGLGDAERVGETEDAGTEAEGQMMIPERVERASVSLDARDRAEGMAIRSNRRVMRRTTDRPVSGFGFDEFSSGALVNA